MKRMRSILGRLMLGGKALPKPAATYRILSRTLYVTKDGQHSLELARKHAKEEEVDSRHEMYLSPIHVARFTWRPNGDVVVADYIPCYACQHAFQGMRWTKVAYRVPVGMIPKDTLEQIQCNILAAGAEVEN